MKISEDQNTVEIKGVFTESINRMVDTCDNEDYKSYLKRIRNNHD